MTATKFNLTCIKVMLCGKFDCTTAELNLTFANFNMATLKFSLARLNLDLVLSSLYHDIIIIFS